MQKPESVSENETHKIPWDFEIQMDHVILAKRRDRVFFYKKKRTWHPVDFTVPIDQKYSHSDKQIPHSLAGLEPRLVFDLALPKPTL